MGTMINKLTEEQVKEFAEHVFSPDKLKAIVVHAGKYECLKLRDSLYTSIGYTYEVVYAWHWLKGESITSF